MSKLHDDFILACTKINGQAAWVEGKELPRCILENRNQFTGESEEIFIDFTKEKQIDFSSDFKTRITINDVTKVNAIKIKPKGKNFETDMMIITSKNSESYFDEYGNVHVKIR
jgi:hypothetical protein